MRLDTVEGINRWLEQSGALSEALMRELCLVNHGYSAHLAFRMIIDVKGCVLEDQLDVDIDLDGVQRLMLDGGLTKCMIEHPEEINWGLSEVALVRVTKSSSGGVRFEALWESERRIEIECRRITFTTPGEWP